MNKKINKIISVRRMQVCNLLFNILTIISLLLCTQCINYIITNASSNNVPINAMVVLFVTLLFYIISYFIGPLLYRKMTLMSNMRLHNYVLNNIIKKDLDFYRKNDNGYITQMSFDVTHEVSNFYSTFYLNLIINVLSLVGYFSMLFFYSWKIGTISLACILLLVFLTRKVVSKQNLVFKEYRTSYPKVTGKFLDYIDNIYTIQNLNKDNYFENEYNLNYKKNAYDIILKWKILEAIYTGLYAIILYVIPLLILIMGICFGDLLGIALGATVSSYTILGNLQEPIRGLASAFPEYKKNKINVQLLVPFLTKDDTSNLTEIKKFETLSFKSKGITYGEKQLLNNIEFLINKGDFVLIHGKSGAGKSTIFKLLTKQIVNDNVSVLLNNNNLININSSNCIYCVTQNSKLFRTTVLDNICCGFKPTNDELNEIFKVCELEDFIKKYGVDKQIDSISSNLSGGEISRIALARILIRKPKVLLLDEITSALDFDTSTKIAKNIYNFSRKYDITVLTISHKSEFDKYADKVINL